jgi:hypothetical protein
MPVGTPGGVCSGFGEMPDGSGIVRLGEQIVAMDAPMYRVWQAAAVVPQAEDLINWAAREGIAEPEDLIESLSGAGLFLEGQADVESRIAGLALCLTGACVGNGADRNPSFGLLGSDGARVNVDVRVFEIVLSANATVPLYATCAALDGARPGEQPYLKTLAAALPILVRNGVVRLESPVRT